MAGIAEGQHGVIGLPQLVAIGLSPSAVRSRVAVGGVHRIHGGVYSILPPSLLSIEGRWLAAVLACGRGAMLSHLAGAAIHEIRKAPAVIDVSVPRPGGRARPGIRIHRVLPLDPRDHGRLNGIPCTSLPRTLLDIGPLIGQRGVERAIAEAQHRKTYDRKAVEGLLLRERGRPGAGILRTILTIHGIESTWTASEIEERFLKLSRRARFPMPLVNSWISVGTHSYKCDFIWHDARLTIETDGRDAHTRELQFEEDRRRDATLKLEGWEVLRFTWRQVMTQGEWVSSVVRRLRDRRIQRAT